MQSQQVLAGKLQVGPVFAASAACGDVVPGLGSSRFVIQLYKNINRLMVILYSTRVLVGIVVGNSHRLIQPTKLRQVAVIHWHQKLYALWNEAEPIFLFFQNLLDDKICSECLSPIQEIGVTESDL